MTSTWYGSEARLFTADEFSYLFGRPFDDSSDAVSVMNGDGKAYGGNIVQVRYYPDSKNIFAVYSDVDASDKAVRLNYIVTMKI